MILLLDIFRLNQQNSWPLLTREGGSNAKDRVVNTSYEFLMIELEFEEKITA